MANQKAVSLSPSPSIYDRFMPSVWSTWFNEVFDRLGSGPFKIQGYSVSSLTNLNPDKWGSIASTNPFSSMIWVYDESGGPCLAYSDGTDWRRISDNTIVS